MIVAIVAVGVLVKTWKTLKTINVPAPTKLPEPPVVIDVQPEIDPVVAKITTKKPRKPRTKTPKDAGLK